MRKQSSIAQIAIFFAIMLVIHLLSSVIFNLFPVPIKPTIVHIPVIIASILYGPKVGALLGALMGIISLVTNTIVLLPTSHLFSPFVPNGNIYSLIIALVPRILIGITPYFVYKYLKNKYDMPDDTTCRIRLDYSSGTIYGISILMESKDEAVQIDLTIFKQ